MKELGNFIYDVEHKGKIWWYDLNSLIIFCKCVVLGAFLSFGLQYVALFYLFTYLFTYLVAFFKLHEIYVKMLQWNVFEI